MTDGEAGVIERVLDRASLIAVVGLSSRPGRPSNDVAAYLLQAGFSVIPVNPNEDEVFGIPSADRLEEIGRPVDIVSVFRRPQAGPGVARSAVAIGAGALWMQPGAESDEAASIARTGGLDVVSGPCIMAQHRLLQLRRRAASG